MKVGDLLLVVGPAFFEKTSVKEKKKGIYILENGIIIDRTFHAINSKYTVKKFDEEEYELLESSRNLTKYIEKLGAIHKKGIKEPEKLKYAAKKLGKIIKKLE